MENTEGHQEYDPGILQRNSGVDNMTIFESYESNREKILPFLKLTRVSRKYGFPVVCSLSDKQQEEQLLWAKRLLLMLSGTELDTPVDDKLLEKALLADQSALAQDANMLVCIALGNTRKLNQTDTAKQETIV